MAREVSVVRAGAERLGELEPLWRALHDHHSLVGSGVAPIRAQSESWERRRAQYEAWFREGSAVLFLAEAERPVGYLMLQFVATPPTWALGEPVAAVETLSLLPDARGRGVGAALMAAARAEAQSRGAATLFVELVHTNEGARRFYESEGFAPFYLSMLAPVER